MFSEERRKPCQCREEKHQQTQPIHGVMKDEKILMTKNNNSHCACPFGISGNVILGVAWGGESRKPIGWGLK